MRKQRFPSSSFVLLLSMVLLGCSGEPAPRGTAIVAIDTSDSAAGRKGAFYQATLDGLMALPMDDYAVVYRFDAKPAEIHAGAPPESTEDAAKLLKRAVEYRTDQKGTNLAKLILLMDRRMDDLSAPVSIQIFTDCGIELMTAAEKQSVQRITQKWASDSRVHMIRFRGLRDGYREEIRDMIKVGPSKFQIDDL